MRTPADSSRLRKPTDVDLRCQHCKQTPAQCNHFLPRYLPLYKAAVPRGARIGEKLLSKFARLGVSGNRFSGPGSAETKRMDANHQPALAQWCTTRDRWDKLRSSEWKRCAFCAIVFK